MALHVFSRISIQFYSLIHTHNGSQQFTTMLMEWHSFCSCQWRALLTKVHFPPLLPTATPLLFQSFPKFHPTLPLFHPREFTPGSKLSAPVYDPVTAAVQGRQGVSATYRLCVLATYSWDQRRMRLDPAAQKDYHCGGRSLFLELECNALPRGRCRWRCTGWPNWI